MNGIEQIEGYEGLVELIRDREYNFTALAITSWHLKGVKCAIKYLRDKGISVSGILCIMEHGTSGICISQDMLSGLPDTIDVCYLKEIPSTFGKNMRKIAQILRANIFMPNNGYKEFFLATAGGYNHFLQREIENNEKCVVRSIIFEEGVQTYLSPIRHDKMKISAYMRYKFKRCIYSLLDITKRKSSDIFLTLFTKSRHLTENGTAIDLYKYILSEEKICLSDDISKLYEDAVVINLQTFYDEGEIENNEDIQIISDIVDICIKLGKMPIIKLHPRDMNKSRILELNKGIVDSSNISQESIINSLNIRPCVLIGFTTTTLLTAKLFWDIETISISGILGKNNSNRRLHAHIDDFRQVFQDIVVFTDDYVDFENKLSEIINKGNNGLYEKRYD